MRIGTHQGVGVGARAAVCLGVENHAPEIFQVDLVDDAGVRGHHLEVAEGRLTPTQEGIALAVARELDLVVRRESARAAVLIHLHRVVDDELCGGQRVYLFGVATEFHDGIAHRREVDDAGHTGEVLKDHAGRCECDFV